MKGKALPIPAMVPFPGLKPNPFRFLLYTEWIMLASCGALAALEAIENRSLPVEHTLILVLLGSMGLRLPDGNRSVKIAYTASELGLIFFGTALGYLHILPTLYMIVVIRSCFLFQSFGRWFVAGLVLILFFVDQIRYLNQVIVAGTQDVLDFSMHIMAETLVFALATYFIVQLVSTLLDERQMRQQLAEAHAQLQHYAQRIEDLAAVQERNRIARDIHDSLGHALTTLNVQLQTAVKLWQKDPGKAKPFLVQAQHLGATAMKEVRQSVGTLRADVEDRRSLNEKIYTLVADFRKGTDLTVYIDLDDCRLLPNSISKTLFRVVQESLTNISKHAQATTVTLEIDVMHDIVHLTVADNGQGFSLSQVKQGFGLQSMKERVAVLHGCMFFETNPGEGCSIYASIPLKSRSHPNFRVPQSAKLSPIGILDRNS